MNEDNISNSNETASNNKNKNESKKVDGVSLSCWQFPVLLVLFVTVIFVAIKTVAQRHEARAQYVELQKLEKERDKLVARWSRLKLEQSTMLNQVRVERLARLDLKMQMPKPSETKVIREKFLDVPAVLPVMASSDNSAVGLGE